MVTVVASETFTYAGITRYMGDSFDVSNEDARILSLMGRIDMPVVLSSDLVPTPRRRRREQITDSE